MHVRDGESVRRRLQQHASEPETTGRDADRSRSTNWYGWALVVIVAVTLFSYNTIGISYEHPLTYERPAIYVRYGLPFHYLVQYRPLEDASGRRLWRFHRMVFEGEKSGHRVLENFVFSSFLRRQVLLFRPFSLVANVAAAMVLLFCTARVVGWIVRRRAHPLQFRIRTLLLIFIPFAVLFAIGSVSTHAAYYFLTTVCATPLLFATACALVVFAQSLGKFYCKVRGRLPEAARVRDPCKKVAGYSSDIGAKRVPIQQHWISCCFLKLSSVNSSTSNEMSSSSR
jgi:hypothetical protein